MEIAYIGQPYNKIIPIIKDNHQKADNMFLSMIKNKNFNIQNMVTI